MGKWAPCLANCFPVLVSRCDLSSTLSDTLPDQLDQELICKPGIRLAKFFPTGSLVLAGSGNYMDSSHITRSSVSSKGVHCWLSVLFCPLQAGNRINVVVGAVCAISVTMNKVVIYPSWCFNKHTFDGWYDLLYTLKTPNDISHIFCLGFCSNLPHSYD